MSQSKLKKALGLVKDRTSIGLAKVGMATITADLEVAIVKATRHSSSPPDERHIREILTLTSYSRYHVGSAVSALSKRLAKTRNWTVALKSLILVHRLLADGDPSFEQELSYATRRGTRILNLSDFRDVSHSDSWDFSAFVRTYALYLDQRLEARMKTRDDSLPSKSFRELGTDKVFARIHSLQHILERFLATRPTGYAKQNRLIIISLYPVVQESFAVYNEITEIMSILIDRFTTLEVPDCVHVYETFSRVGKQLDELDSYYDWSKGVGIARSFEYPVIERVTPRKLQIMDDFICDKSASFARRTQKIAESEPQSFLEVKALPAPGDDEKEENIAGEGERIADGHAEAKEETALEPKRENVHDLLDLSGEFTAEENNDRLALALFSGEASSAPAASLAETINSAADWELALVESTSNLAARKAELGGGFNVPLLDGLYDGHLANAALSQVGHAGSASSMAMFPPQPGLLALPAPPNNGGGGGGGGINCIMNDPFAASTMVAPPPYVQISDMEKKQGYMIQEQQMWNQYAKDGMQGQLALTQLQYNPYGGAPGLVPGSFVGVQPGLYGGYTQS
ncbi:unnamed protein product [Victoria cruziana]